MSTLKRKSSAVAQALYTRAARRRDSMGDISPARRAFVAIVVGVLFLVVAVAAFPPVGHLINENVGTTTAVAAVVGFVYAFLTYQQVSENQRQTAELARRERLDAMTPVVVFRFAGHVKDGRFTLRIRNAGTGPALHLQVYWRSRWKGEWRADEPAITMQLFTLNIALGPSEEEELHFRVEDNNHPFFAERAVNPYGMGNSLQEGGFMPLGSLHVSCRTLYGARRDLYPRIEIRRMHQLRSGDVVETMWIPDLAENSREEVVWDHMP